MPHISAFGREAGAPAPAAPGPQAPPLAGIACCARLPEREGLGPPLEEEIAGGTVLDGRFVIREAIGRSGMATIYRAEDRDAGGGSVAVKVPLARVESDPVSFGRFEREERIGLALRKPGLLRFLPLDVPKSRPFIVTEFLDGCTLALVIHLTHPVPERDALRIMSAVCDALAHMHERGFIHRDLKPANIMILRDQTLCLMDFGLAAEIDSGPRFLAGLTPLFGTPEYMAPEQVLDRTLLELTGKPRLDRRLSFLRLVSLTDGRIALRQLGGGPAWVADVRRLEFRKAGGQVTADAEVRLRRRRRSREPRRACARRGRAERRLRARRTSRTWRPRASSPP